MWMLGLGQPRFIPPLNDAMTIQMGGDILGEMIIFIIGASLVIAEFSRSVLLIYYTITIPLFYA